ncbi:Uncharacterized protein TPAR_06377 [Tolypocladium paradoxum]|uniref:Uncharacterized protein n=1 Tax=Tolypocladium paradoxum TaxID=94208 RepID=A0A2S4KTD4_9HYPO|nr:Uncharacterized protein TPAR_06377 [Tolypocladium paradoxum]
MPRSATLDGGQDIQNAQFKKLAMDNLHDRHRAIFSRALSNVLATEIAELTCAQIVDGIPLSSVEKDGYGRSLSRKHPLHEVHTELCPGVLERTHQLRSELNSDTLQFDSRLIHGYMAASPGSRAFQTHLIELIARAVHDIAAEIHKIALNTSPHKDDGLSSWTPPKEDWEDELWWELHPDGAPPTLFQHPWYCYYDQYPQGVSDGVGYWAEARILGGVVLFDRRDPEADDGAEPNAIYFHSDRYQVTYRIYQLTDGQRQLLLNFLQSQDIRPASPLPILCGDDNRIRVDPEEPIGETKIYRDIWERKPLTPNDPDRRLKDVCTTGLDWLTVEEWKESHHRAFETKWKQDYPDLFSDTD